MFFINIGKNIQHLKMKEMNDDLKDYVIWQSADTNTPCDLGVSNMTLLT